MDSIETQVLQQPAQTKLHPCQRCGACCASFRVSFYWLAAEVNTENSVPKHLSHNLDQNTCCMKGTHHKHHPKCEALSGRIGEKVDCQIYTCRPSPCRNFKASYEAGQKEFRCDEARRKHGLRPLTLSDWK